MSNNRDFSRKRSNISLIDVGEYYSNNLVIFSESPEEGWETWKMLNPEISRILVKMFGEERSRYLASELEIGVTVEDLRGCLVSKTSNKPSKVTLFDYPDRIIDRINC